MATGGVYFLSYQAALDAFYASGTWKAMLVSGYSEDVDAHDYINDVNASEIAGGNGYTTGGKILVPTVTFTAATNTVVVTFPQMQWTSATISADAAVYYQDTGNSATSRLGGINRFTNQPTSVTSGTFTAEPLTITFPFP